MSAAFFIYFKRISLKMDLNAKKKEIKHPNSLSEIETKLSVLRDALSSLTEAVSLLQSMKTVETNLLLNHFETDFPENGVVFQSAVKRYEVSLVKQALRASKGNQTRAAKLLKLKLSTLNAIIKRNKINFGEYS